MTSISIAAVLENGTGAYERSFVPEANGPSPMQGSEDARMWGVLVAKNNSHRLSRK
jgi:hypothetical protein